MSARAPRPVKLKAWPDRDAETVVSVLRETTRYAKQERPTAVIVLLVAPDGTTRATYHVPDRPSFLGLVGAIEEWKAETFAHRRHGEIVGSW